MRRRGVGRAAGAGAPEGQEGEAKVHRDTVASGRDRCGARARPNGRPHHLRVRVECMEVEVEPRAQPAGSRARPEGRPAAGRVRAEGRARSRGTPEAVLRRSGPEHALNMHKVRVTSLSNINWN